MNRTFQMFRWTQVLDMRKPQMDQFLQLVGMLTRNPSLSVSFPLHADFPYLALALGGEDRFR